MPIAPKRLDRQPRGNRWRRGQATTEWMLLIAVIVVAVVAAGAGLAATFADDMESLGQSAGNVYASGDL